VEFAWYCRGGWEWPWEAVPGRCDHDVSFEEGKPAAIRVGLEFRASRLVVERVLIVAKEFQSCCG
jgi:hypothetical protein